MEDGDEDEGRIGFDWDQEECVDEGLGTLQAIPHCATSQVGGFKRIVSIAVVSRLQ